MLNSFYSDIIKVLDEVELLQNHLSLIQDGVHITKPKEQKSGERFGDLSLNLGFIFAQVCKMKPIEIATIIAKELDEKLSWIESASAIGGFINIHLTNQAFADISKYILLQGEEYGSGSKKDIKVQLDYASINPTGPMHAGHLRATVIADALANILDFAGYQVYREYYINDTGGQAKKLVQAGFHRYFELLGHPIEETIDEYAGEYLIDIVKFLIEEDGDKWLNSNLDDEECYERFRSFIIDNLLDTIKVDLLRLNVKHDTYFSEHEMNKKGEVQKAFELLKQMGLVSYNVMPNPVAYKGAMEKDIEIAVLELESKDEKCKSEDFKGDVLAEKKECVRLKALTKTDGTHTYLLGDIAYHLNRYNRDMDWLIDFFGADHSDHAKVLTDIMQKLRTDKKISIKTCQIVKFEKDGEEFKLSKRAGTYITASDIIDAVGVDAIRINMLSRKADSHLILDVEEILELDENNPVFYIQYAHARCYSVLQKESALISIADDIKNGGEFFQDSYVKDLLIQLLLYPAAIDQTIKNLEPHIVLTSLQEISSLFHTLWTAGNRNDSIRLAGRVEFVQVIKSVLNKGMKLLGVTPRDKLVSAVIN